MNRSHTSRIEAANAALIVDGDFDAIGEFFSPDYVAHLTGRDLAGGHEAVRKVVAAYRSAFHGIRVEVEILAKARDRIAWQRTLRATHTGAFKGFPATGRPLVWRDMVTSRFEDCLIAEEWVITDLAERLLVARKR